MQRQGGLSLLITILKTLSFFKIQLPLAVSDKYCQKDDNQNRS